MKTYQDLMALGQNEEDRMEFVRAFIDEHRSSALYKEAQVADEYYKHKNRTIMAFQKLLYTVSGKAVPDNYSANWKMATNHFHRFVLQEVQYLLGNGISWKNVDTKDKLGEDFDTAVQLAAKQALIGAESFGFWNLDHLDVFSILEFAPLYNEENGALMAGIRFWQIDSSQPLRATLYELDGYTDYLWKKSEGRILKEKRPYIYIERSSKADGTEIYDYENYPNFPIVPLWGNQMHQSELAGLREQIDCYDIIKSGFANDLDDASQIYWIIQNGGGMDDVDLAKFVERIKTVKAAVVEDGGARAESHTLEVPYASREALMERIDKDLYRDAMALDTTEIASGAVAKVQIDAAYEPLNSKVDDFEYCVRKFLAEILHLAGIEDESPSFTRSKIANSNEELSMILESAEYLSREYVTRKILSVLGDIDMAEEVIQQMDAEELNRSGAISEEQETDEEEEEETTEEE